ncbi:MAG TPA: hypothetical protein VFZ25_11485 [Chloroflexota bacterium]|nr:hypothetical protein [Chloroflexota bacterium]
MDQLTLGSNYLSYAEARRRLKTMAIVISDVPTEAAVSLPIPTKRYTLPGYAVFAAPAVRIPGQPPVQGAPDRWWVLNARGGHLVLYGLTAVLPFAPGETFGDVTLPNPNRPIDELRDDLAVLDRVMSGVVNEFFAGAAGEADRRRAVSETLALVIPAVLAPRYRALAPDFFSWLEA